MYYATYEILNLYYKIKCHLWSLTRSENVTFSRLFNAFVYLCQEKRRGVKKEIIRKSQENEDHSENGEEQIHQ